MHRKEGAGRFLSPGGRWVHSRGKEKKDKTSKSSNSTRWRFLLAPDIDCWSQCVRLASAVTRKETEQDASTPRTCRDATHKCKTVWQFIACSFNVLYVWLFFFVFLLISSEPWIPVALCWIIKCRALHQNTFKTLWSILKWPSFISIRRSSTLRLIPP